MAKGVNIPDTLLYILFSISSLMYKNFISKTFLKNFCSGRSENILSVLLWSPEIHNEKFTHINYDPRIKLI